MIIEARCDAPEILQPGDQAFDLPASLVAPERSPVLRFSLHAVGFMRRDHLNALRPQRRIERVRIVSTVPINLPGG